VNHVIMGQVLMAGQGQVPARQAAHGAGIPMSIPSVNVNKVCLSGINSIYLADQMIQSGDADIVVAGGMESMSNAPYLATGARSGFRYGNSELSDSIIKDGLWCAFDSCLMGLGTERYSAGDISREAQDELAMVMAHEMAHLQHRHASAALGRGVAVGVILSVVSAELGRGAAAGVLSQAGQATMLSFTRDQERAADEAALAVLAREYGHLGGATDLFRTMANLPGADSAAPQVELLRTHPLTRKRLLAIEEWARRNDVPLDGARRPLPSAIAALQGT
jgi:acetyl-CoA acetyltransferase